MSERHEVDAWMTLHNEFKKKYLAKGWSEEDADDQATKDVRREIRDMPPSPSLPTAGEG